MHGSIACVAVALAPLQLGLQEPTRWAWGPWVIQKAAGIDGPDSDMPAPGAVFVRAPLAAARTHTHTHTPTHAHTDTPASMHVHVMRRQAVRVCPRECLSGCM